MKPSALAPLPERLQHDRVTRAEHTVADSLGSIGQPWISEGSLGLLLRRGDISEPQFQAGAEFAHWFRQAGLDPLKASDLGQRLDRGGRPYSAPLTEHARMRVNAALDALGGLDSPLGACAWHVIGMESSIAEWAQRRGWAGQPIRHESAKLVLIAALAILAVHFRISLPDAPNEKA